MVSKLINYRNLKVLKPREDAEADMFARALLMPPDMVFKEVEKFLKPLKREAFGICKNGLIEHIEHVFKVPKEQVIIRLYELGVI